MSLAVVFAGTPDFAVPCLRRLAADGHQLRAVYTQPDRPAGRGRQLAASPVKQAALGLDLPVMQPLNFKDAADRDALAKWEADVMIVVAYGLILPQSVLDIPRLGCLNVHASSLPRWRGAAPIQRALLAGDSSSGVTIMQMDAGLDTGAMLLHKPMPIGADETGASLHDRLAAAGAEALSDTLTALEAGTTTATPQPSDGVTYAHKLSKAEAAIDWQESAVQIERRIRAFNPWPGAHSSFIGKPLRLWGAELLADTSDASAGTIVKAGQAGVDVATGAGLLRITQLQPAGKRSMAAGAFAASRDLVGQVLGL